MITPHTHVVDPDQFDSWLESAPNGQWCSYDPAWPRATTALMKRVYRAYEGHMVLVFQQRRAGRSEYLAVRVSRDTWTKVEDLSAQASYAFGARMKDKLERFLSGQGVVA